MRALRGISLRILWLVTTGNKAENEMEKALKRRETCGRGEKYIEEHCDF